MNPSDLPSTSRAGLPQPPLPPGDDITDGNCISVPASDRDVDSDVASASNAIPDSLDGGDTVAPGLMVKTSLQCFAGEGIYKMSAPVRGICLIINNITFDDQEYNREGSEKDGESLKHVFGQLGFTVHYFKDLKGREMIDTFQDYSKMETEHESADCFVGIILTHGWKQNMMFGTDHVLVSLDEDLISLFNNGKLSATNPKA